jgi:hypothetical protein
MLSEYKCELQQHLMLYSNHFTKHANLFYGREVLTQSTQSNV